MAFDVESARKDGYTDLDIAKFLGEQKKFNVQGALKDGYQPSDIIALLNPPTPGLLSTIGSSLAAGAQSNLYGAGAAAAELVGADTKAKEWDKARAKIAEEQKAKGGNEFVKDVTNMIGAVGPAAAVQGLGAMLAGPTGGASEVIAQGTNLALFAYPAARETYHERIAAGDTQAQAIAQAARAGAVAQLGGQIATRGGTAAAKLLGGGAGKLGQLGAATGEGAVFSGLSTASEKALDKLMGVKNDKDWIDPRDMAVQAAGMGILRVPHLKGKPEEPTPEGAPQAEHTLTPEQTAALDARLKAREDAKVPMRLSSEVMKEAADATRTRLLPAPEPEVATPEAMKAAEVPAQEAPPAATGFTHADLAAFGTVYGKTAQAWAEKNLIGKDKAAVQAMVEADPSLVQGKGHVPTLLREIIAPEPATYETPTPQPDAGHIPPARNDNRPVGEIPSVPSEPNSTVAPRDIPPTERDGSVHPTEVVGNLDAREAVQPPPVTETKTEPPHVPETFEAQQTETKREEPAAPAESVNPEEPEPSTVIDSKESADAALQKILDDHSAPKALKNQAFEYLDAMDKTSEHYAGDMETAADRAAMLATVSKFVESTKPKRFNTGEAHPEGVELHADAITELKDNNLVGALHHISQNSKTKFSRVLADRLKMLLGNTHVHLHDELKNDAGETARGAASIDGHHIYLHTAHGMDEETLLHESVHAATERILQTDSANLTQAQRDAVGELKSLWNAAKQDKSRALSPEARAKLSEFVAEGMTNPELQKSLAVKAWKSQTRWDGFKRVILKMLGVAQPKSMLDMHTAAVDTIFARPDPAYARAKRVFLVSPSMKDIIDHSGAMDPETKSILQRAMEGFKDSDLPLLEKIRTQGTDIAAAVEHRINKGGKEREGFEGAVRDSLGRFNPMGLYRQAQDYAKMVLGYLEKGSLVKDATTGKWKVEGITDGSAPIEVYKKLQSWGKSQGMDYTKASHAASRILEGVRLYHIRESNRIGATHIPLHSIDRRPNAPHSVDQQIDIAMRDYKANPELGEISQIMDSARIKLIDHMVNVGRLSADQGKEWKSVAGYVPFDRIVDFADRLAFHPQKRMGGRTPLGVGRLPELLGSDIHRVGNVFDNYMNTMGWMMGQIMHTDARNEVLKTLAEMGSATRMGNSSHGLPNATYAFEAGEKIFYKLPSVYDVLAFKDLTAPKGKIVSFLGQFSHVLRTTITAMPPFALKQVTDDIQRAIMTSGVRNPLMLTARVLANFPKIAWAEVWGKGHPEMEGLGSYGVTGGFDFLEGKPAANLLADLGFKPRGKLAFLLHHLEGITRASDFAVRKGVYDQTLAESKSAAMPTGDTLLAQTRARELINFRRRGASDFMATATATIPFFNAYVQGMDVLLRAATGKGAASSEAQAKARNMFLSRAAIVTAMSTMYALAKQDDEEYKDVGLNTRNNNWILGNGLKLAVPGELGALFKSIPEYIIEYMHRSGTSEEQDAIEAVKSSMGYIFEQFGGRIVPIPQAVKPLLEAFTNHSFLTGSTLEGTHQASMMPHSRVNERTSELAVQMAKFTSNNGLEVSPIMIDTILQGYFGSTAAMTAMVTDQMLNPTRVDRPLNKWALVSNYMLDPVGTRRVSEFYDNRERVVQLHGTLQDLATTDINAAEAFATAHAHELATYQAVNATLEHLQKTRAYKNYLSSAKAMEDGMTQDDRGSQTKQIRQAEVELTSWLRAAKTELRPKN